MSNLRTRSLTGLFVSSAAFLLLLSVAGAGAATHANGLVTSCSLGSTTASGAPSTYDPVNHRTYVSASGIHSVVVISKTCTVSTTIALPSGAYPYGSAYDPQNNYVYVVDFSLDQVYAISGSTVVATIGGFNGPVGIIY